MALRLRLQGTNLSASDVGRSWHSREFPYRTSLVFQLKKVTSVMIKTIGKKLLEKRQEMLSIHPWVAFVLPIAVFLVVGSFEPKTHELVQNATDGISSLPSTSWFSLPYSLYPWIYTAKLFATLVALCFVWPDYRPLMRSIGWKGISIGIVGGVLWITICNLEWEQSTLYPLLKSWRLESLLGTGSRSAFNPFLELKGNTFGVLIYLAIRGIGLVLVVPVIEEHFLRGLVMRYLATDKWWNYPIGQVTVLSAIVGTVVPMLMHPDELLAAAVWFSLITILAWHTNNLWECIAAHCTSNLIVGAYVIVYGAWRLV